MNGCTMNLMSRQDLEGFTRALQERIRSSASNEEKKNLARKMSEISAALASGLLTRYVDREAGVEYSLRRSGECLLGGGPKTSFEEMKRLEEAGNNLLKEKNHSAALEKFRACLVLAKKAFPNTKIEAHISNRMGQVCLQMNAYENALTHWGDSLLIEKKLDPRSEEVAECSYKMSVVYKELSKNEEALTKVKDAKTVYEGKQPVSGDVLKCHKLMGKIYEQQEKFEDAIRCYQASLDMIGKLGQKEEETVPMHTALGRIYLKQRQCDKALQSLQQAIATCERLNLNTAALVEAYINNGEAWSRQGKLEEALNFFEKGRALQERLEPKSRILSVIYENIGIAYKNRERWGESKPAFEKSLEIDQILSDELHQAKNYQHIGDIYQEQGQLTEALEWYGRSESIVKKLAPDSLIMARLYGRIGTAYCRQNNVAKAVTYSQEALSIQQKLAPNRSDALTIYNTAGLVYEMQEQHEKALFYYLKALELKENADFDGRLVHQIRCNVGLAYSRLRRYKEALDIFEAALASARQLGDEKAISDVQIRMGNEYANQRQFTKALEMYQQVLAFRTAKDPEGLGVAKIFDRIGIVYARQDLFEEGLKWFDKSFVIYQKISPESVDMLGSYSFQAQIYNMQGKFEEAISICEKGKALCQLLFPRYRDQSTAYQAGFDKWLGDIYKAQGKLNEAVEQYEKSLNARVSLKSNTQGVATVYTAMGGVRCTQGQYEIALALFEKSLAILQSINCGGEDMAHLYNSIGRVYRDQGKYKEALQQFEKSQEIRSKINPEGRGIAEVYRDIGDLYTTQGKWADAFLLFEKAYQIRTKILVATHPDLLEVGLLRARAAISLGAYAVAVTYANQLIVNDPNYKYAYDSKGVALHKRGQFEEAVRAFDQALALDAGYADASLHRLEALQAQNKLQAEQVEKAKHLPQTGYDEKKRSEWRQFASESERDIDVDSPGVNIAQTTILELPKTEFSAGSDEYQRKLDLLIQEVQRLSGKVKEHETRLQVVEEKVNLLQGYVFELKDGLRMLQGSVEKLNGQLDRAIPTDPVFQRLIFEKQREMLREKQLKTFNQNTDQRKYFYALLSELGAAYQAAQVMQTERFTEEKSETFSKASEYIGKVIELIPVAGHLVSKIVTHVATLVDIRSRVKDRIQFMRIRNLAPSMADFEQIALRIAIEMTVQHTESLALLQGAVVASDWKEKLGALKEGLEAVVTEFLKDKETEAEVMGRCHALKVIAHLQEESVAENYAMREEENPASAQRRSRFSVVSAEIVRAVSSKTAPDTQVSGRASGVKLSVASVDKGKIVEAFTKLAPDVDEIDLRDGQLSSRPPRDLIEIFSKIPPTVQKVKIAGNQLHSIPLKDLIPLLKAFPKTVAIDFTEDGWVQPLFLNSPMEQVVLAVVVQSERISLVGQEIWASSLGAVLPSFFPQFEMGSSEVTRLMERCKGYTSRDSAKMDAVQRLQQLLAAWTEGWKTKTVGLPALALYVDTELRRPSNPIFGGLITQEVKSLFGAANEHKKGALEKLRFEVQRVLAALEVLNQYAPGQAVLCKNLEAYKLFLESSSR